MRFFSLVHFQRFSLFLQTSIIGLAIYAAAGNVRAEETNNKNLRSGEIEMLQPGSLKLQSSEAIVETFNKDLLLGVMQSQQIFILPYTQSASLIQREYYLDKVVGAEGGELNSEDGKVRMVVPAGALSNSAEIKLSKSSIPIPVSRQIKPIICNERYVLVGGKNPADEIVLKLRDDWNKITIQSQAIGSNVNLFYEMMVLSMFDCEPQGLVFNKPVELIYKLDAAEVPGTVVELGEYKGQIVPTGQKTVVAKDGYTVKFSLRNFSSTYACFRPASIKQGAVVGAGVKIPLPDLLTGSFSHSVPITVPPGRKGMQPSIGLSYRSSNPNSWVGIGFSLNPGYIVRSTRLGPAAYDDKKDTFYFVNESGTTELVNLIDNLYQAKIESGFTKFFKETDDSWKAITKEGAVLKFGQTAGSKETSDSGTFGWYLTKVVDTNENYIEYNYTKDQGKVYLSRIDYTGNETGVSPTNSVEFYLEPREDIGSSYISTAKIAQAKRLKEIEVRVKGELVWRYELEYEYSKDSNRSLLRSVKQSGSDGKSLPEQKFSYQKAK